MQDSKTTAFDPTAIAALKPRASAWFESLRDRICDAFEAVEDEAAGPFPAETDKPGRFVRTPWTRTNHDGAPGGGGVMSLMAGRVFEKVGGPVSAVHGSFAPRIRASTPPASH